MTIEGFTEYIPDQPKPKANRNAYINEWRKRNPERVREINERYWAKRLGYKYEKLEPDDNAPDDKK